MCHKEDIGREPINWASVETFLTNQVEALTKPMFAEKDKKIAYLEMKVATHEAGLTTDDEWFLLTNNNNNIPEELARKSSLV